MTPSIHNNLTLLIISYRRYKALLVLLFFFCFLHFAFDGFILQVKMYVLFAHLFHFEVVKLKLLTKSFNANDILKFLIYFEFQGVLNLSVM